jgi:hypothetical protein
VGLIGQRDIHLDHIAGNHATGGMQQIKMTLVLVFTRIKRALHPKGAPVTQVAHAGRPLLSPERNLETRLPAGKLCYPHNPMACSP